MLRCALDLLERVGMLEVMTMSRGQFFGVVLPRNSTPSPITTSL